MATCVKTLPTGTVIGKLGSNNVTSQVELWTVDPSCTTGQIVMTSADLKLEVKPEPVDPQRVADMYQLAIAFVAIFAALWGLKQLYRMFSGDMERD